MTIHFVGAGPGPADLLTVRATRMLGSADVLIAALATTDPDVIALCREDVAALDLQQLASEQVEQVLLAAGTMGHAVVLLLPGAGSLEERERVWVAAVEGAALAWDHTAGVATA
ncbi:SAM-dependent methyltransferase [Nocardioides sp. Bht2]|uniref:SAM-dependent methyltransferase n=1 Tax=Nocardioides sp. Bht2 TaxID=3392297 RepID=UPI0039B5738B